MQEPAPPVGFTKPARQAVHVTAPTTVVVEPAGQLEQAVELVSEVNVPMAQLMHPADADVAEY